VTGSALEAKVGARFDDVPNGVALQFPRPDRTVVVWHRSEVASALAAVERATDAGAWAFGYLAYEAGADLDRSLPPGQVPGVPYAWFGLGAPPRRTGLAARSTRERGYWISPWQLDGTPDEHAAAVRHVQDLITAGSVYQVNLTTRARATVRGDLTALYGDLVHAQGAGYNALLHLDGFDGSDARSILSVSPELFLEWTPPLLRCRPMKGTARRDPTESDDPARQALLTSAKDRAENVMIVDLVRNDLSRIARTGTVRVTELGACEPFGPVYQLSSTIECEPQADTGLRDVMTAVFPSGSITGAPKSAAMHAVADIEATPRGVYCGAIGWIAPPGAPTRARFNVAIRTLTIDTTTGAAEYGTGGAITTDSNPAAEYQEMLDKLAVLATNDDDHDLELIETFAHDTAGFRHLDRHLSRLASSASYFGIPYSDSEVRDSLHRAVPGHTTARVRLRLRPDGHVTITADPMPATGTGPVLLAVDTHHPVATDSIWQRHKTNRRQVYDEARRRHPDAHDVIMTNDHGEITETTIANLAARIDGRWYTPPLSSGCLPGIGRAVALDAGTLHQADLTTTDLEHADTIAVVNSLRGWRTALLNGQAQHRTDLR
jgi:para-aminobenzoate synthetase / 4-amino-4-deoxychorismate lyase